MADQVESQPGRDDELRKLQTQPAVLISLVENTLDILAIVSLEGTIQYINPAVEHILGYLPAELIGTHFKEIIHPEDKTITDQILKNFIERDTRVTNFRARFRHKNGEWRWLEASGNIRGGAADTNQIIVNLHDVTESKILEETLNKKVKALAALQATAQDLTIQQDWLPLLNAIVERARTLIDAPSGFIYLYENDTDELALVVDQAYVKTPGIRLKMGEGMAGWVAQHRQPLIVDDYSKWPNRSTQYDVTPFHACIEVPMLYGGQLIGVLGANESAEAPRQFDEADMQILSLFAAQAAAIVHDARLVNSIQNELAEREKAEKAFRASEVRFRNSFNNAPIGMALVDAQENFLLVNQTLCEILGYTEDELLKTNVPAITHPDDLLIEARYKHQAATGEIKSFYLEKRYVHKDGYNVWGKLSVSAVKDDAGNLLYYIGQLEDITDQKLMEKALQQRLSELEAIQANVLDLSAQKELLPLLETIIARGAQLLHTASGFIYLFDQSTNDLILTAERGHSLPIGIHLKMGEGLAGKVAETRKPLCVDDYSNWHGRSVKYEGVPYKAILEVPMVFNDELIGVLGVNMVGNSTEKFTEADAQLLTTFASQAANAVRNARLVQNLETELAERKKAEEALRASEERFRSIYENATVGLYRTTPEGRILLNNPALLHMLGYDSSEDLAQRNLEQEGFEAGYDRDAFRQAIEKDDEVRGFESAWKRRDGSPVYVRESARAIRDAAGKILYYEGIVEDISERKYAERVQTALYRIAEASLSTHTLDELFPRIHHIVSELMPARNFYIALHDPVENLLHFPYFVDEVDSVPQPRKVLGNGLTEYVLISGKPLLAKPDIYQGLETSGQIVSEGAPSIDWLGVPLKVQVDTTIGVMVVQTYQEAERYSDADKDILIFVSTQIAMAIERKRTEDSLRANEQRLRRAQTIAHVGNWELDIQTHAVWGSEEAFEIYGLERRRPTLPLEAVQKLVLPQYRASLDQALKNLLTKQADYDIEFQIKRGANGDIRTIHSRAELVCAPDGTPLKVMGVIQDITESKQAEAALKRSETFLRSIIENEPECVKILNPDGSLRYMNPAGLAMIEVDNLEQVMGQPIYLIVTPEHRDAFRKLTKAVMQGKAGSLQFEIVGLKGTRRWLDTHAVPLHDENGNIEGLLGLTRDITERKQAEQALRASEARYRAVVENQTEFIVRCKPDGTRTFVNEAYCRYFGLTPEQAVGTSFLSLVNAEDRQAVIKKLERLSQPGNEIETDVHRVVRPDGSIGWQEWTEKAVRADSGAVIEYQSVGRDITERKQAEEADARRRGLLERVIELGKAVTQITNLDECLRKIHAALRHELGFDRVGIFLYDPNNRTLRGTYGTSPMGAIEDTSWFSQSITEYQAWQEVISSPRGISIVNDYHEKHPDLPENNEMKNVRQHVTFSAWAGDTPVAVVAMDNVITQRLILPEEIEALQLFAGYIGLAIQNARLNTELEQRVNERTRQLEDANKELESFSYSVSHDLRAPLRAISSYARIFEEDYGATLPAEASKLFNNIRISAQNMNQLIEDLLKFSRLGRHTLIKQNISPTSLIQQALATLTHEQAGRQVEINIGELPACEGDPTLLLQVWVNLISNALKYTRQRPVARIEIGCQVGDDKQTVYYIRDNGVGFDMRYADKLFRVFQRLHSVEDFEGTGVGLALVNRIITRHGGRIWAESERDVGTIFYFTL